MFGTYRFILAQLVVLGHVLGTAFGIHFNDAAVLDFFMLSGFVMTVLIRKSYPRLGKPTLYFYADRFLRIFPQYCLFLTATLIALQFFDFQYFNFHFSIPRTPSLIAMNYLIAPMNYTYFSESLRRCILIPPAWSLGLEEQFYWFFPFFVINRPASRVATGLSLVVYFLAFFAVINTQFYGYRMLPGVFFIFMMGKNLADYNLTGDKEAKLTMLVLYAVVLACLTAVLIFSDLRSEYRLEVLLATAVGFPVLWGLSKLPRRKWDELLGHTSYGVFLSHIFVLNLMVHFRFMTTSAPVFALGGVIFSTLAGFLGYTIVEKLITPLRMRLRERVRSLPSS